jgi:hypothetical protein
LTGTGFEKGHTPLELDTVTHDSYLLPDVQIARVVLGERAATSVTHPNSDPIVVMVPGTLAPSFDLLPPSMMLFPKYANFRTPSHIGASTGAVQVAGLPKSQARAHSVR